MPDTPPAARWRLDAVALTLLLAGAGLAVAVGTSSALAGGGNALGAAGEVVAACVVDPLGWAAVVFLAGWFAVAGLLVVNRSPGRVAGRVAGWAVLAATGAVAADWMGLDLPTASVAGRGGSVGAYLHFTAEDALDPPAEWAAFAVAVAGGLVLAAEWLVVAVLRFTRRIVVAAAKAVGRTAAKTWRAAVWGNDRVAAGSDKVVTGLGVTAKAVGGFTAKAAAKAAALVPARAPGTPVDTDTPPPVTLAFTPKAAAGKGGPTPPDVPITRVEPLTVVGEPGTIPIHSHVGPAPVLRAVPPDDADGDNPDAAPPAEYELPSLTLLNDPEPFPVADHEQKLREVAVLLEKTFADFGLSVKVVGIHTGPVITQYEISLETGMRLNKVTNLADDLALNLRVQSVRVVAPLPGRNTVGIEVPNEIRQPVRLKELVTALAATPKVAKFKLPIFLGKDVEGRPLAYDLADMPHLLIAGRTGTGKSVCLNTVILSLLLTRRPDECRMILIDPKKVELSDYAKIPHLMTPVVKDEKKAEAILAWAVEKMEERYEWLHRARVRKSSAYNELPFEEIVRRVNPDSEEERRAIPRRMPYIMILIDEVGDLMMKMKKEIEGNIILLAQKSRAAGIHLILATQKPTVDVITGLIKSNLPARICFQVTNRSDSAVVLDEKGAEKLLGKGDLLLLTNGSLIRAQGALVEDGEIERVVDAVATDTPNYDSELLNLKTKDQQGGGESTGAKLRERDPLYEQAVEIVIREQRGSTSLLQRTLGIGYGKASRFVDYMAEDGIVGGFNGSNARDVLVTPDEWDARKKTAG